MTRIERKICAIGRDSDCDTCLSGSEISRKHAETRLVGPAAMIRDLQSRNGVFLNGKRIEHSPLSLWDVVRLGEWVGVVVEHSAAADPTFRSIVPGWFGGATLHSTVEPARRVAPTILPVTIQGETGTGKDGLARAVHIWSGRMGKFVPVNCAAIPAELAEAELFGYRKGAFTGADRGALGYFRTAHRGTLFLDEILELALPLQAKLLRVLETQEVVPIGEADAIEVDVRVVAATQQSLSHAVSQHRFRADLMARLDGLTVVLPALRERRDDVAPLFMNFLANASGGRSPEVEPRLIEQLLLYDWPLNVRELSLLASRLVAIASSEPLRRSLLPERVLASRGSLPRECAARRGAVDDDEAFQSLVAALREHRGNVVRAAAKLGISRARAYRLLDARPDFNVAALREEG